MNWSEWIMKQQREPYFLEMLRSIESREAEGVEIFPSPEDMYKAFVLTPEPTVVILGQDPYHQPGQACGLAFSVKRGVRLPPSLKNIYKEVENDVGCQMPEHGDLTGWAKQGVLLLNSSLTVEKSNAGCHTELWKPLTGAAIKALCGLKPAPVFLLWGKKAQNLFEEYALDGISALRSAHPSPFSAHSGFFGSGHFSKVNEILQSRGQDPIIWEKL